VPASSSLKSSVSKSWAWIAKNVLDAKKRVVLGHTLTTGWCTSLDFTDAESDSKIGNDRILRLTAAVGNHDTPTIGLSELGTGKNPSIL